MVGWPRACRISRLHAFDICWFVNIFSSCGGDGDTCLAGEKWLVRHRLMDGELNWVLDTGEELDEQEEDEELTGSLLLVGFGMLMSWSIICVIGMLWPAITALVLMNWRWRAWLGSSEAEEVPAGLKLVKRSAEKSDLLLSVLVIYDLGFTCWNFITCFSSSSSHS